MASSTRSRRFLVSDMVSDSDVVRFKDYFVRVRLATEPIPAY